MKNEQNELWDQMVLAFPDDKLLSTEYLNDSISSLEKEMITNAMYESSNNRTVAAKCLGISRENLIYKLKKYKLSLS
jgi:transcriptional regulator with PAS, ATPase and Fis domain